jgi:hypothetical protein
MPARGDYMLLVKAWVGLSEIHRFGLIAHEFIPKGTVIWKLMPGFDVILSEDELRELPPTVQEQVMHYGFFHLELERHILCADDDRFANHSDTANVKFCGNHFIAIRDIHEGEEITNKYTEFGETDLQEIRPTMSAT